MAFGVCSQVLWALVRGEVGLGISVGALGF